jgi:hypothetical protein
MHTCISVRIWRMSQLYWSKVVVRGQTLHLVHFIGCEIRIEYNCTSMCGVHAREKFFYLVHQPSAILFLLSLCTQVTGKPAAAGRSFVLMCHCYFARSTLPGTGWQHEERDPVPELTPGRPRLYLQLRGGHPLDSELSHAVLSGPMPNSSSLCPQSLHFLSSRRQPETGKRHRRLVRDLHGGVAFPMAREAKAPAAQNVHWDRE